MINSEIRHLTLSDLAGTIKQVLDQNLEISYWVVAEVAELKVNAYSGHCYLELVEKEENSQVISARMRATIWAPAFRMLKPFFETSTGINLGSGIKVMVRGIVEYHELYGMSLNIRDIDPAYTVGEMALKMQQTLELLEKDGVIDMNRELNLPMLPKTLAVISSSNAAGYEDFMDQLSNNGKGYKFQVKLFEAVMQGEKAPDSVMDALSKIFDNCHLFDAVLVLRGGGAVLDLNCFNDYELCFMAAQFPLPILTGIGHEKDETVLDLVAHTKLKTPTAAAEFLVGRFAQFEEELDALSESISYVVQQRVQTDRSRIDYVLTRVHPLFVNHVERNKARMKSAFREIVLTVKGRFAIEQAALRSLVKSIEKEVPDRFRTEKETIDSMSGKLQGALKLSCAEAHRKLEAYTLKTNLQSPHAILNKGYSLTTKDGKLIVDSSQLKQGDKIKTIFSKGQVTSRVD